MAEKRVSVRLVAEGGRQVRAELEGIGEAGARGFSRLSSEMEEANVRLGSFARKAGIALAAVTVASAAAGVAMIRSGLDTIGAQADMAASLKTTVESLQVLTWAGELAGVSMGEIEQATKKLTTRLSEAAAGSGSAVGALQRLNLTAAELQALPLDQRIVAIQEALNRLIPEAERAAVASDLFGDKAALAFLRIDSATLREAAQDVQDFGVAVSAGKRPPDRPPRRGHRFPSPPRPVRAPRSPSLPLAPIPAASVGRWIDRKLIATKQINGLVINFPSRSSCPRHPAVGLNSQINCLDVCPLCAILGNCCPKFQWKGQALLHNDDIYVLSTAV